MIETSSTYKQKVLQNGREWRVNALVTTRNGSTLSLTNSNILENGLSISDGTSEKGKFCVGSFVSKQLTLKIANFDGVFKEDKFDGATIYLKLGLVLGKDESTGEESIEWIKLGAFYISNHHSAGGIITIIAYDAAEKFERKYNTTLTYPATLYQILQYTCSNCGVPLYNTSITNGTYVVDTDPSGDDTTYADVVSYVAQLAASWARINNNGELVLGWYDTDRFYQDSGDVLDGDSSGDDIVDGGSFCPTSPSVDGGTFLDYSQTDSIDAGSFTDYSEVDELNGGDFFEYGSPIEDFILGGVFRKGLQAPFIVSSLKSCTISTNNITITGIQIIPEDDKQQSAIVGTTGYIVKIEKNPFAQNNIDSLAIQISKKIIDFSFRPMQISALDDPSIEAGDVVILVSPNGEKYSTIVSNIEYSIGDYERISADAESESENQSTSFNVGAKAGQLVKEIGNPIDSYPPGTLYISKNSTSPASIFGGTWEQIKDTFLLSAGDTYTAGNTGGKATVSLTQANLPNCDFKGPFHANVQMAEGSTGYWPLTYNNQNPLADVGIVSGGSNIPMNIMPPYLCVYMWERLS